MQPAIRIEHVEIEQGEMGPGEDDQRIRDPRMPVGRVTTARSPDGRPQDVLVLDLSARGLLYRAGAWLPVGTVVTVGLAGAGSAEATIVRRDGDRHGAAFRRPLTPRQLADAFAGDPVIHPLFVDANGIAPPSDGRWPRPVRAVAVIAAAVTAWGAVAAMGVALTRALA